MSDAKKKRPEKINVFSNEKAGVYTPGDGVAKKKDGGIKEEYLFGAFVNAVATNVKEGRDPSVVTFKVQPVVKVSTDGNAVRYIKTTGVPNGWKDMTPEGQKAFNALPVEEKRKAVEASGRKFNEGKWVSVRTESPEAAESLRHVLSEMKKHRYQTNISYVFDKDVEGTKVVALSVEAAVWEDQLDKFARIQNGETVEYEPRQRNKPADKPEVQAVETESVSLDDLAMDIEDLDDEENVEIPF